MRLKILTGVFLAVLGLFAALTAFAGPDDSATEPPETIVDEEADDADDGDVEDVDDGDLEDVDDGDLDDVDDGAEAEGDLGPAGAGGEDGQLGVPDDSPACENHEDTTGNGDGCDTWTKPDGSEQHLPDPAIEGKENAQEHRDAHGNDDGLEVEDDGEVDDELEDEVEDEVEDESDDEPTDGIVPLQVD